MFIFASGDNDVSRCIFYMETEKSLLDLPVWQMTGAELLALLSNKGSETFDMSTRVTCTGVHELAMYLKCCESTIYALKRDGVLDEAVVSQIGKRIVFDGEKAREAAKNYQKERRGQHE